MQIDVILWYSASQPRFEISSVAFLGPFAKLRKATTGFVMSVLPFAWNNSAPNGRILIKFYI
jgi:hypothetical protein